MTHHHIVLLPLFHCRIVLAVKFSRFAILSKQHFSLLCRMTVLIDIKITDITHTHKNVFIYDLTPCQQQWLYSWQEETFIN